MDNVPALSRRRFLGGGSFSAAAAFSIVAPQSVRGSRANSRVSFGLLGAGARGTYDARLTALRDLSEDRIGASDIDGVIIAAPPSERPRIFEAAVEARKHIYCEAPMGIDPEGCRRVIRAARRADPAKCISVGFQRRYSRVYLEAYDRIRSGRIGTLIGARGFRFSGTPGDLVTGPACHGFDVLHWFLGAPPLLAVGMGGAGGPLDHLSLTFEFPGGLLAHYDARTDPAGRSRMGEEFTGSAGVIHTSYRRDMTVDALDGFIGRILSGNVENTAERAALSTLIAILGRTALAANRQVTWKELGSID